MQKQQIVTFSAILRAAWRTRNRVWVLTLTAFALSCAWHSENVVAAKRSLQVSAKATFAGAPNDPSYRITNDGTGAYTDQVDGVECVFFDPNAGGSGDFVFDTSQYRSSVQRQLFFDFGLLLPGTSCGQSDPASSAPSGLKNGHLSAGGLWYPLYTMPEGSQPARAWFGMPEGGLHFGAPSGYDSYCSTPATVTKSVVNGVPTWTIYANYSPGPPATGDIAVFLPSSKRTAVPTDWYYMPFQVTITLK